jgi:hypothetical protein
MRQHPDELSAWADDPVVQALQAPGSADELTGVEEMVAEFRAAVPRRSRRRVVHRVGTGATTVIIAIGLTGGVAAAAFTRTLPAPLQSAMHSLLGPVGVPAAEAPLPHPHASALLRNGVLAGPTGSSRPRSLRPLLPTAGPVAPPPGTRTTQPPASAPTTGRSTPAPTTSAAAPAQPPTSSGPQPAPSPSATSSPPPASITAKPGRVRVPFDQRVGVKGSLLTASGAPVAGHRVFLQQRPHGTSQWQRVASGRTRSDGTIVLRTPALARTVDVRMVTPQGLHTSAVKLTVLPHVAISISKSANGKRYVVTVTVKGAQAGDTVTVGRRSNGDWSRVATKQLPDSDPMTLTFSVSVPTSDVHYRVRVVSTAMHGDGFGYFTASAA